ncbi:MAG: hypothetical protein Phyf2KO_21380 [Phycisphaerales bacterium]
MRARTAAFIASIIAVAGAPAALAQDTVNPTPPSAGDASTSGPRLSLSSEIVDFGDVDDSKTLSQMVTITNTGDEVLEIGKISVTCGCTASEVEKNQLQPGESTQLEVQFNPNRRNGDQHGKRVTIDSNDPSGAANVTLKAFVIPRVVAEPSAALFGQVVQGDGGVTQIRVMGMTEDFKVTDASVDREDSFGIRILETTIVEREHPKTGETMQVGETTIEVSMSEAARIGRLDGQIRLETNEPSNPVLTLRAMANVAGDINSIPGRISLSALTPGQEFEKTVKVISGKGTPFKINKARFVTTTMSQEDRDSIEITYKPLPEDSEEIGYELTIKGKATDTMRIIQGSVVMLTDSPGQRIVRTQVSGVVRIQNASR